MKSYLEQMKKMQADLRMAKRALKLADSVMSYCGGDKWERECTADERKKFTELYEKVMGKGSTVV